MNYYRASNFEVRSISDELMSLWVEVDNPKRFDWIPMPDEPLYDHATQHQPVWGNGQWIVTQKTNEEMAADSRKVWPSKDAFWNEFTEQEQLSIITSSIPGIKLLDRQLVMWSGEVWSDDERVTKGLDGLVATGIITAERKNEITKKQ